MVVGVLVELSSKNIDRVFDYLVPKELLKDIKIGIRVSVPFGRMNIDGFILEIKDNSNIDELKEIIAIKDKDIVLNEELLELGKALSKNTISTLISCYQAMLPKALKARNKTNSISIKYDTFYKLNEDINLDDYKYNDKQLVIINRIKKDGFINRKDFKDSISSINTLLKKNIIVSYEKEHYRLNYDNKKIVKHILNEDQEKVVNSVINNRYDNYLLFGITGSGKTEVYMEIIDYYLKMGKTSIVLVPEISLTPQMVNRFQNRFGDKIAALHSALSDGEKYDEWRRIARGEVSIVIGARSAIFAPLNNIGVIIVDEEHSDSYKQSDTNPRYNAKDVALERGKNHKASVIFGSATPSLEYMARARKGVFKLLELPKRVNSSGLPLVKVIDMNKEIRTSQGHFSKELVNSINERLDNDEQIILLLNRRGYANFVSCKNCGFTFKCPNCDITLTYHKSSNTLRCHYCGYADKVHDTCPECKEKSLSNLGIGTQRIEEEINDIFDNAKVLRMDFDTTNKKGMHEKMIEDFKNHKYNILLGTQIVAKGLDFGDVTLVGVINADTSLNIPDFRSSETTYSLLSQVAGRSGRSKKGGEVIIQTYNPDHYTINYVKHHDYIGFYEKEMSYRRLLKYPPYFYICLVRISGKDYEYVYKESLKIKRSLDRNLNNFIILGPTNSSILRVNNIYRFNIILKYKVNNNLYEILEKIVDHYKANVKVKIDIDFNPSQMI